MTEQGMAAFLCAQGGGIGDVQAIISNLAPDEAIVPVGETSFRLFGWGRCYEAKNTARCFSDWVESGQAVAWPSPALSRPC